MRSSTIRPSRLAAILMAAALAFLPLARAASADLASFGAKNAQEGDNSSDTDQSGESSSGDAVAGQVTGVVSSGDVSLDASNVTDPSSAESGDASGSNNAHEFTGLSTEVGCGAAADIVLPCSADVFSVGPADNVQEGDNDTSVVQLATVTSGDAIAGGVAGVVASGDANVVLGNGTFDSDATSGDSTFDNTSEVLNGLRVRGSACCPLPADFGPAATPGFGV